MKKIPDFNRSWLQSLRRAPGASQTPAFFGTMTDGQKVFVKEDVHGSGMLDAEADGLLALAATETLRVPTVLYHSSTWLVMEEIEREAAGDRFWLRLAEGLVQLHRQSGPWGWSRDNFIGRNLQRNIGHGQSWAEFFWRQRLEPQLAMLRDRGIWTAADDQWLQPLEAAVRDRLDAVTEPASLLHGDLWSGNVLCARDQTPVLIDPAVSYGHRECDLAMTELFGGFAPLFYQRYQELWPLAAAYLERRIVYNFYHKLNHANLYGSGYIWDVKKTLWDIVERRADQPPMAEKL